LGGQQDDQGERVALIDLFITRRVLAIKSAQRLKPDRKRKNVVKGIEARQAVKATQVLCLREVHRRTLRLGHTNLLDGRSDLDRLSPLLE
jgi:hypothetical protein